VTAQQPGELLNCYAAVLRSKQRPRARLARTPRQQPRGRPAVPARRLV